MKLNRQLVTELKIIMVIAMMVFFIGAYNKNKQMYEYAKTHSLEQGAKIRIIGVAIFPFGVILSFVDQGEFDAVR